MFTKIKKVDYMNIQEYDIMNEIAESGYENQRILTEKIFSWKSQSVLK